MNAIIGLCHFCPDHGPKTLFCTQAFKYAELPNNKPATNENEESQKSNIDIDNSSSHHHHHHQTQTVSQKTHKISETLQPPLEIPTISTQEKLESLSPTTTLGSKFFENNSIDKTPLSTLNCKPCRAFDKDFHHYISYDKAISSSNASNEDDESSSTSNNICYISQSTPSDNEVFALVRKACLRTLHCEVFEDPIYFDDDKNGSVIGYEFNIKDSEGRGFQRSYSLIIIMKDRIYLQHLWSFLSQQISTIASNIKTLAQKKFEKDLLIEKEINSVKMQSPSSSSCGNTNSQLTQQQTYPTSCRIINQKDKKLAKQTRGLIELTDDPKIFAKLHMWFTWILRMSACQISEDWVTGPLTEDLQVKLEREQLSEFYSSSTTSSNKQTFDYDDEEIEDDLSRMKINDNTIDLLNTSLSDTNINETKNTEHNDTTTSDLNVIGQFDSESDFKSDVEKQSDYFYDNDVFLNNLQVESLRQLFKLIGFEYFHQIAYHTIIGNQVIVRGKHQRLISSIIKTLEELIPLGCVKSNYFSNEYIKSYECKLLGLDEKVNLFKSMSNDKINDETNQNSNDENSDSSIFKNVYLDLNEYILVDLIIKPKELAKKPLSSEYSFLSLPLVNNCMNLIDLIDERNYFNITIKTNVKKLTQVPSYLTKVESFLMNEKLDDRSISCLIRQTKEEWLKKFYGFSC